MQLYFFQNFDSESMFFEKRFIFDKKNPDTPSLSGINDTYKRSIFGHPDTVKRDNNKQNARRRSKKSRQDLIDEIFDDKKKPPPPVPTPPPVPNPNPPTPYPYPDPDPTDPDIEPKPVPPPSPDDPPPDHPERKNKPFMTEREAIRSGRVIKRNGTWYLQPPGLYKWAYRDSKVNFASVPKYKHSKEQALKSGIVYMDTMGRIKLKKGYKRAYPKIRDNWYTTLDKESPIANVYNKHIKQINKYVTSRTSTRGIKMANAGKRRELLSEVKLFKRKGPKAGWADDIDIIDDKYTAKGSLPRQAYAQLISAHKRYKGRLSYYNSKIRNNPMVTGKRLKEELGKVERAKTALNNAYTNLETAIKVYYDVQIEVRKRIRDEMSQELLVIASNYNLPSDYNCSAYGRSNGVLMRLHSKMPTKFRRPAARTNFFKKYFKNVPLHGFKSNTELRNFPNLKKGMEIEMGSHFRNLRKYPLYQVINAMISLNNISRFENVRSKMFSSAAGISSYYKRVRKIERRIRHMPLALMIQRKEKGVDLFKPYNKSRKPEPGKTPSRPRKPEVAKKNMKKEAMKIVRSMSDAELRAALKRFGKKWPSYIPRGVVEY